MREKLKNEIYKHGYSIYKFALISGISLSTFNHYFRRKSNLRGTTIYLIAETLNEPYEKIYEIVESEK